MNNGWYNERLVQLKYQEVGQEIDQIRLLRDAGLSDGARLVRLGRKVSGWMLALAIGMTTWFIHKPASFKPAHKKTI
ncbi:MAG: hypothetical protein ACM3XO_20800 [Bacteroidota bacterium]|jgi:hypothetical protein